MLLKSIIMHKRWQISWQKLISKRYSNSMVELLSHILEVRTKLDFFPIISLRLLSSSRLPNLQRKGNFQMQMVTMLKKEILKWFFFSNLWCWVDKILLSFHIWKRSIVINKYNTSRIPLVGLGRQRRMYRLVYGVCERMISSPN